MGKQDLNSLYAWAQSVASSSSSTKTTTSRKRARDDDGDDDQGRSEEEKEKDKPSPANPPSKEKAVGEEQAGDSDEEAWDIPTDTTIALKMMHAQFPKIEKGFVCPFVLRSQLYSVVKDHTLVDRELEVLKQQMVVRIFKLSSGQDDYAIMFLDDYLSQVKAAKKCWATKHKDNEVAVFDWFLDSVLPAHVDVGITQIHLETLLSRSGNLKEIHVPLLVKAGLLVRQLIDDKSYWFAIPNVGFLLKSLTQGRKELLSLLNRRRYKEMLLSALEKKRLRTSLLDMRFHIRDLLGSGKLCLVHTPAGLLVRMPKD